MGNKTKDRLGGQVPFSRDAKPAQAKGSTMSDGVHCANPACTQEFPISFLVDGTLYQCPACATQFVYKAPVEVLKGVAAPILPATTKPSIGAQSVVPRRIDQWWIPALITIVVVLLVGFLALIGIKIMGPTGAGKYDNFSQSNFSIKRPEGFTRDAGQELDFQVDLVYTGAGKKLLWAVLAKDYGGRVPTPRELLELAIERLKRKFPDNFEYEKRSDGDETIANLPFMAHDFHGRTADSEEVAGEFFVGTAKGIGYVFFGWTRPEDRDEAKPGWRTARNAFSLLETRAKWTPEAINLEVVDGKGWELRFDKKFWTQEEISKELKEAHPKAVIRVEGRIPGRRTYAGDMAEAYVIVLEGKGNLTDGVTLAKKYLTDLEKPVDESPATLESTLTLEEEQLDKKIESQGTPQMRQLLRLVAGGDATKIYLIQVGSGNKQTVLLAASCPIGARKLWEENLINLSNGLIVDSP